MSIDDDLDSLYGVPPAEFTALRKKLTAAAKARGDSDAAGMIAAARRPTVAAWVVNRLVRSDDTVRTRLGELGDELRAAHADMDGQRIRELTGAQRKVIAELVRVALAAADLPDPSAALREDVTGTLQAAIADREVAGRLGRLEKAELFSGFGDFGAVSERAQAEKPDRAQPARPVKRAEPTPAMSAGDLRAARKRRDTAAKGAEAARKAAAHADGVVEELQTRSATALRRYQKVLQSLSAAEDEMNSAAAQLESARAAAAKAAEAAQASAAELADAVKALADLPD